MTESCKCNKVFCHDQKYDVDLHSLHACHLLTNSKTVVSVRTSLGFFIKMYYKLPPQDNPKQSHCLDPL